MHKDISGLECARLLLEAGADPLVNLGSGSAVEHALCNMNEVCANSLLGDICITERILTYALQELLHLFLGDSSIIVNEIIHDDPTPLLYLSLYYPDNHKGIF